MKITYREFSELFDGLQKLDCISDTFNIQINSSYSEWRTLYLNNSGAAIKFELHTLELNNQDCVLDILFYINNKYSCFFFKEFFEKLGNSFPSELLFYIDIFSEF